MGSPPSERRFEDIDVQASFFFYITEHVEKKQEEGTSEGLLKDVLLRQRMTMMEESIYVNRNAT
jgi:hypothetical protein